MILKLIKELCNNVFNSIKELMNEKHNRLIIMFQIKGPFLKIRTEM